jgi:hypothetical protein
VPCDGCCDDAEDFFWRYSAVKRITFFAAFACALLTLSLLGCGTTNHLQSITLDASLINGVKPTGQAGFINLVGNGGTIQLRATGNYSSSQTKDLTNKVTYDVIVDPVHGVDAFGDTLLPPCQAPCQDPSKGTVEYSVTGLITAVEPATCTWVDLSADPTAPAWFYSGDYVVTVSFEGITSQPVYIPIASSAGADPDGACGPSSSS